MNNFQLLASIMCSGRKTAVAQILGRVMSGPKSKLRSVTYSMGVGFKFVLERGDSFSLTSGQLSVLLATRRIDWLIMDSNIKRLFKFPIVATRPTQDRLITEWLEEVNHLIAGEVRLYTLEMDSAIVSLRNGLSVQHLMNLYSRAAVEDAADVVAETDDVLERTMGPYLIHRKRRDSEPDLNSIIDKCKGNKLAELQGGLI